MGALRVFKKSKGLARIHFFLAPDEFEAVFKADCSTGETYGIHVCEHLGCSSRYKYRAVGTRATSIILQY